MGIIKNWKKISKNNYAFFLNEKEAGQLSIQFNTMETKAIAVIGTATFHIKRTGFWKSNIEVADDSGKIVMKVYHKKWYANTFTLEYEAKEYQLITRNNSLAEWAMLDNETEYLAYGLTTANSEIKIRISSAPSNNDLLPDFLLWYLFVPIAQENTGDHFTFQMLAAAQ